MITSSKQSTSKRILLITFLIGMAVLSCIVAVILTIIIRSNRPYEWSQKVTAIIEVDGKRYTGSTISSVQWKKRWVVELAFGFIGRRYQTQVDAEATVIDIPGYKPVFVLLQNHFEDPHTQKITIGKANRTYIDLQLAVKTFLRKREWGSNPRTQLEEIQGVAGYKGETKSIPPEYWPVFVVFDDLADPTTMHVVSNDAELSTALGATAHIVDVTLTLANDTPTTGRVYQYLPWLPAMAEAVVTGEIEPSASIVDVATDPEEADYMTYPEPIERQVQFHHFVLKACFASEQPCKEK